MERQETVKIFEKSWFLLSSVILVMGTSQINC